MLSQSDYELKDPDQLITPCLLVYPELIRSNLLAAIAIAGDPSRLRPHVKTHKTPEITRLQLDLGINKHKCATLREAEMLAECGAPDVLVAYPQVGPAIRKLSELAGAFSGTRFSTIVDDIETTRQLAKQFQDAGRTLDVLVDIDNGMHRTGIPAGAEAVELYQFVSSCPSLNPSGLHVYDGQNHQPSRDERQAAVSALMQPVVQLVLELVNAAHPVPKLVLGGTPTFGIFTQLSLPKISAILPQIEFEYSPGTCVLSDYQYGRDFPDIAGIQHAAVIMTRVVSKRSGSGQFTIDLGNKAIAADPPAGQRCHLLGLPDAVQVKQNEEHMIVSHPDADRFRVGDVLYAIPAHICPTVALHRFVHPVVAGEITGRWEVAARDRIYT